MSEFESILVVEDSPDDLLLIRRAFQKGQIANPLFVVSDGDDAISYLGGENQYADRARYPMPSLVLLDLRLPRKNGFDVLRWIRAQGELAHLPVIVLTNSHAGADVDRAYDLGASGYLVKPVSSESLLQLVHTMHLGWMRFVPPPDTRPSV
jgi:CheY-like chemotaxis protein